MSEQLILTEFGIRLDNEQVDSIDKLCKAYIEKWQTTPNIIRYRFLNYDTIVNTLNHMIETGDNFAKTYMQLYFDDIRERFNLAFIEIKAYIKTRNIRTKKVNRVITSEEFIRTTY